MQRGQDSIMPQFGNSRLKREESSLLKQKAGQAQLDKNQALLNMDVQACNTSLLLAGPSKMIGGPSEVLANPEMRTISKNRNQFQLGQPSRFGANLQNLKPLVQASQMNKQRLDSVLNMDSDEEDMVNMGNNDLKDDDEPIKKTSSHEPPQQFPRRSKRLSTISHNKSDISNKQRGISHDSVPNQLKNIIPEENIGMISMISQHPPLKMENNPSAKFGGYHPPAKDQSLLKMRTVSDFLTDGAVKPARSLSREQDKIRRYHDNTQMQTLFDNQKSGKFPDLLTTRLMNQKQGQAKVDQPQNVQFADDVQSSHYDAKAFSSAQKPNKRTLKGREKVMAYVEEEISKSKQQRKGVSAAKKDELSDDSDSELGLMNDNKKRRGRKRERDDLYFSKAINKIEEIKEKLKNAKAEGMTVKERQRLRNQISAQQSRIRKKEEVIFLNKITREKDEKFALLVQCMTQTLQPKDLLQLHRNLANCWEISEISNKNIDLNSYKRQKNSQMDSQVESKTAHMNEVKSNGNFPRMTRHQSKNFMTKMHSISKDSDVIAMNPMGTESLYNGSGRDNTSLQNEQIIRSQFQTSLIEAFVTKQEEFDQFKQNDEKQYKEAIDDED